MRPHARFLVVDDDAAFRTRLVKALAVRGYDPRGAGNVDEAIDVAREFKPEAAVVDLRMPGGKSGLDLVAPLVAALEDPTVAVAGPFGIVSDDLREFRDADDDVTDVDAIQGYALAFRRSDYAERGPLDEHFAFYRNLDIWWSLVLRDQPEDAADDAAPRRAVRVPGIPITRHDHRGWTSLSDHERERLSKKNFYRILKRFATRRDLLVSEAQE